MRDVTILVNKSQGRKRAATKFFSGRRHRQGRSASAAEHFRGEWQWVLWPSLGATALSWTCSARCGWPGRDWRAFELPTSDLARVSGTQSRRTSLAQVNIEWDHVFVYISPGAPEAEELVRFGLHEGFPSRPAMSSVPM